MHWRMLFGLMTFAGALLLAWDLLTIGQGEARPALVNFVVAQRRADTASSHFRPTSARSTSRAAAYQSRRML